jgi:hypothetical protein
VPVKAQLLSSSSVKADCPSRLPQGLAGAINATLSPERHVPAEEEHALQRCDPSIEDLDDQLTATDTLCSGTATNACSNSTAHSWRL